MDITQIDENFKLATINEPDIEWFNANDPIFCLEGIFYDFEREEYRRLPKDIAENVSEGVDYLASYTAGGRLRFISNSPYVAIKCIEPNTAQPSYHMPMTCSHGFTLYSGEKYCGPLSPTITTFNNPINNQLAFEGIRRLNRDCLEDYCLYFPLYSGVKQLYIGLKKGSVIQKPKPYTYPKPVVFYGSSITEGGCASKTGNDYEAHLSRWLNFDYINLGFSGSAKGEPKMNEYLASLDASVFVIDYDHNAPTMQHLEQTHYNVYQTIRAAHKKTPIILISAPVANDDNLGFNAPKRRDIIKSTYLKAKKSGDKNVYFINGKTLFGKKDREACTVDGCHPNDLGFYRMAENIYPVLKKALKKSK